jgi:hypothetical protein
LASHEGYVRPNATADALATNKPGLYEVRLHDDYPAQQFHVVGRAAVTVD